MEFTVEIQPKSISPTEKKNKIEEKNHSVK